MGTTQEAFQKGVVPIKTPFLETPPDSIVEKPKSFHGDHPRGPKSTFSDLLCVVAMDFCNPPRRPKGLQWPAVKGFVQALEASCFVFSGASSL